ncbi:flagellar basal-body MS-ring/collar protein FliF [Cognatilysobacter bugurensis]|uniref:Flagellar M-ring protein n=1 Tax=Cognatilysobacter bugurensis TaxID=543356 RepID=A0A918WAN2_9GAMM|nr:flagellar basal-body MS-ring/collar protein FliF [Lysobacter bugurensis]GHA90177.1 flagellar M-ring protein [Lysobacter bugurensis]
MSTLALPNSEGLRNLGRLQDIPAVRQLAMLGVVAVAIALGLWLFFWTQKPDYVPVFAGLDPKATGEASDLLGTAKIPFRLDPGTGALAVPVERLGDAKLALAAAGLPASGEKGFETMQGDQGFGTSQFVENARYQHALETELARTISNLSPVREARVHLALPKPSAFTRQKEPASASVVLQLRSGATLEQNQVNAIVHLVASSIPGLPTANVTVVDQFGRMLSNPDPNSEDAIGAKQFDQQRRQEAVYVQRIQELLEPMTGPGRVSAQVSVDMDFNETEQARETYGPAESTTGTMVRSEQISEMNGAGGAVAQGVPGSVANTPGAVPEQPPQTGPSSRTAVRNFEVDRTLTHTRQAPGRIRRVTAAVLVDNVAAAPGKGKDAAPGSRALTDAELKRIETLVQQAIGFDGQRGDAVSVVNAPFARDELTADEALPFWEHPRARDLLRTLLGGLAVLAVIFFVIRPTFRQLVQPKAIEKPPQTADVEMLDDDVQVTLNPQATLPGQMPALGSSTPGGPTFDDKVQLARQAVSQDPKRVANVIREWVATDG